MTEADIGLVAAMNRQLQEDEGADILPLDQIESRLRRWIDSSEYRVLMICDREQRVGYLLYAVEPAESGAVYIRQLFVERDRRRMGYGAAAIIAFAKDTAKPGQPIEIDVFSWNDTGRAFWESIGFVPRYTRMRLDTLHSLDD